MSRIRQWLAAGVTCLLFTSLALAQDITKGSIAGVIRDASGAVAPNVAVQLTSPFGDRSTNTDSAGTYSFQNLMPGGGYVVTAAPPGFATAKIQNVVVAINRQTTVDITLEVGKASETVNVEGGAAATIDLSSTSVGATLNESVYKNTAIGRNISSIISMAPGVTDSGGAGQANPSINGASGLENQYVINGANITDPAYGGFGTYSRVFGPLGTGVNFDFVQEVQVQSGGFEAQYGQALGGVINVVTKSGGNSYHGSLYGYFAPAAFQAVGPNINNVLTNKVTYAKNTENYDFGGDLGGYIIKDKLFWYGGFNPKFSNNYEQADPSFQNSKLGTVNVSSKSLNYTGKVNWNLGSKHQFEGSVFGDPSDTPVTFNRGMNSNNDLRTSALTYGSRTWTGRYTGTLTNSWIVTANYSEYYNHLTENPKYNGYLITDNTPVQESSGSSFSYNGLGLLENSESHTHQFAVSTSVIGNLFGQHTLQLGYQFEDDPYTDFQRYSGIDFKIPDLPEFAAAAGQTQFGASLTRTHEDSKDPTSPIVLQVTRGNYSSPNILTFSRYHSAYVEDTWTLGNRLTFKPGMRFEQQAMGGNYSRYVFAHNWAPRIGVILDPTGNRHTKFFANWGRFFEKVPSDIAIRAFSFESSVIGAWYKDPGPNAAPDLSPANYVPGHKLSFQGGPDAATLVAGGTGSEFQDEVVGGFEHEFGNNFTFTGRFVYRHMRRIIEDISGINVTQANAGVPQQYVVSNPSAKLDIFQNAFPCNASDPNCDPSTGYTAISNPLGSDGTADGFPNPSRIYKSMELIVSKRFSNNFQFYGSYVLSKLYGNFQGSFRGDNQQTDPNISSLFDFTNSDGLLTDQVRAGVLPTDRTHQLKMFGNYQWRALNFGLAWNIQSGTPISKLLDHPVYLNAGEVPVGGRGALGRTDWRFPIDLHADYTKPLGEKYRLKLVADFFNIGNQITYAVNQFYEQTNSPGTLNPDFLRPYLPTTNVPLYANQSFYARLAVRFEF